MSDISWAEKIKALESFGLDLKDIGEQVGLAPSTISDIKQGRTTEPRGMPAVRIYQLYKKLSKGNGKAA